MLKSNSSASKRFKITKTGKVLRRKARQNHFNAKSSGNAKRKKHKTVRTPLVFERKAMKKLLPYN